MDEQGGDQIRFEGSDGRRLVIGFAILALLGSLFFGTRLYGEFTDGETDHSPRQAPPASTIPR